METTFNIDKIREQLPFGAQTEIAKKCNVTVCMVNRVLNGKSENTKVLDAIADYLTDFKQQKNDTISRLASLID